MPNAANQQFVKDLSEDLKSATHLFVTDYQGLTAEEFDLLRTQLRGCGARYKVIKNRVAKIVLKGVGLESIEPYLKGPSAIAFDGTDVAMISKILFKFSEGHKNLKIKAGHVFGKAVSSAEIKSIANLPGREVLLATLLARLLGPLQTFVATLNEPIRALHASLSQVAKKKESAPAT